MARKPKDAVIDDNIEDEIPLVKFDARNVKNFAERLTARDDTNNFRDAPKARTGTLPLHQAAERGDTKAIDAAIAGGSDIEETDKREATALHVAAARGHTAAVRTLLGHGADHEASDIAGNTPLHLAATNGHSESAQALLASGADPMRPNGNGRTPLHQAAMRADGKMLEALLAHPGIDADAVDAKGETALATAVRKGNAEGVRLLQAHQADLNKADGLGRTPLRHATDAGNAEMAAQLVTGGADATIADTYGDTPLHASAKEGNAEVAQAVVAAVPETERADVLDQPDADDMTAAQSATAYRHPDLAEMLGEAATEARTAAKTPPMRRLPFGLHPVTPTAAKPKPAAQSPSPPPDQPRATTSSPARRQPFGLRTISLTAPSPAVRAIVADAKIMTQAQKTAIVQHAVATRRSVLGAPTLAFERPKSNAEAVDAWTRQSAAVRKLAASPADQAARSLLTDAEGSERRQSLVHAAKTGNAIAVARSTVHQAHADACRMAINGDTDAAKARLDTVALKRSAVESTARTEAAAASVRQTENERVGMRM